MTATTQPKSSAPKLLPPPNSDCTAEARETVAWPRELLGGNGVLADYNVIRFFADAEAIYSSEGTYQMQHQIVVEAITGFSLFA